MYTRRTLFAFTGAIGIAATQALAGEKHEEKKKGGGQTFVQIPEINVTLPRRNHHAGVLSVGINLDIPDSKLRDYAQKAMPKLRDAYITRLQTYALSLAPGAMVDTEYVRSDLQQITNTLLKSPKAHLLLGSIMTN